MKKGATMTEDDFAKEFGHVRGSAAYAMYLCLLHGDNLSPKERFGDVSKDEVILACKVILGRRQTGGVTF